MAIRVGLGPVFAFEWLMTARRWQAYAMRSVIVLVLLTAMSLVWIDSPSGEMSFQQQADIGKAFYGSTALLLLGLISLAAPAAAAGSICQDKASGNLTLLFATDLSDAEIVLGKLASRLVPVLGLILCAAPVLSIATLFGGIDPVGLVGALLVVLSCAIFGCTLALTLSVWGRKTHEVLLATYAFGVLYLLSVPLMLGFWGGRNPPWWPSWLPTLMELMNYHPIFLVLSVFNRTPPGMRPITQWTHARFLGLGLSVSAGLAGIATWQIRRVVIRQLGQVERASRRLIDPEPGNLRRFYRRLVPMPSLDRNPVLWLECRRKRPSRWALAVWGIYILLCGGFGLYSISLIIDGQLWGREFGSVVNALQTAGGLLMLSVSAATSLAEERQRGSLDVLMATPLSTRSIVWGKWWGTFRTVSGLLILPTMLTFALSFGSGHFWGVAPVVALILAYAAAITSLGLALATWMPRLSQAVGTTVGLYTMMCLGWIPLTVVLIIPLAHFIFGGNVGGIVNGVQAGSPLMGVGLYSSLLAGHRPAYELGAQTAWMVFWILAYSGIALALLLATMKTFNRCLGRVNDPSPGDRSSSVLQSEAVGSFG
ncbi:ABC transporter permease subunit [Isosphaeraceae bacterium EP7]